jgi:geranylgeranyl pyrophosphate synthase
VGLKLVSLLSRAAGVGGMMSGQYLDIKAATSERDTDGVKSAASEILSSAKAQPEINRDSKLERQLQIHNLKTGKLISVCAAGVLEIARATLETKNKIISIADKLGLAFQLQDDLLDFTEHEKESSSLPAIIGYEKTKSMLAKISSEACEELKGFKSPAADSLCDLFTYNLERK